MANLALPTASMRARVVQSLSRPFKLGGCLLVLVFAIVYAATVDTGLQPYELHGGDLITHHYAQVQARPGNAPGYPVYTMGGWLWFHGWRTLLRLVGQPYPNPIPILSSYSTLWALLALWLLYATLGELLGERKQHWSATLFCLLLTSIFGVSYFFWYYATTSEQYSSAVAQTLALLYLYLRWEQRPERRALLYSMAFLSGLALAHMLTVAFIVPPLVVAVLWRDPSLLRNPRAIGNAILAALLPLVSYIYVYLRGALNPQWWGQGNWESPQAWFWWFVSTAQGRNELAWAFEPGRPFFGNGFPETMWHELSLPLFTLGLIGIARLSRRHATLLYGTLLLYAIFCWLYRYGNWFQVILPAYPLILVGLVPFYGDLARRTNHRLGHALLLAALAATLFWRITASLPAADSRNRAEDTALVRAALLLDQPLPDGAFLFAAVDDTLALDYLTKIWGIRPDLKLVTQRDADKILASGGSVYATVDATETLLNDIEFAPALQGFSPDWIIFMPPPDTAASVSAFASQVAIISDTLSLASYSVQPAPTGAPFSLATDPGLDVQLTWQLADGTWPPNLAISVRPTSQGIPLVSPKTNQPIQQDRPRPLFGLWRDRAQGPVIVHDAYRLPLPGTLPDAVDGILVILYTQNDQGFSNVAELRLPVPDK